MSKFKKWLFDLIRPLFVKNIEANEDFTCLGCIDPVLTRTPFCSKSCEEWFDRLSE